jgi:hypothetical protein
MKIKIVRSRDNLLWYAKYIGKTYIVHRIEPNSDVYWVRTGDTLDTLNIVYTSDVEIVKD